MKTANQIINEVIRVEGGYANDPDDLGGETKYGITKKTARENGYHGPMRDLPVMTAKLIYMAEFWVKPGFDQVSKMSNIIAIQLFDIGVNQGRGLAKIYLQRLLNLLTQITLEVDGKIGPMTMNALHVYLEHRKSQDGENTMAKALNGLRVARYVEITEARGKNKKFIYGWLRFRT